MFRPDSVVLLMTWIPVEALIKCTLHVVLHILS